MTVHAIQTNMFAGDDWEIRATLLDQDGNPYNLSGTPVILWTLMDENEVRVIQTNEVNISVLDAAAGKCSIIVPHAITTRLPSDIYTDALRINIGGVVSTLSTGQIQVIADPFKVAAAMAGRRTLRTVYG
jgi:hypothetical protein